MNIRTFTILLAGISVVIGSGCGGVPGSATGSAAIVGNIAPGTGAGKLAALAQTGCPQIIVTLNGAPVDIEIDEDDCSFLIDNVAPSESVELRVELPGLGVNGTIELEDVDESELIEVLVEAGEDSLTISALRRSTPEQVDDLPTLIEDNNVTIFLSAGTYDQDLTVDGNNFTLVGEAGEDCNDDGWTVITGDVLVLKNNATFRNIRFDGSVTVEGNNAQFINSCFGSELLIFGNNTDIDDDDDDDDDDDEGDDD
jgi:hypothetical protein